MHFATKGGSGSVEGAKRRLGRRARSREGFSATSEPGWSWLGVRVVPPMMASRSRVFIRASTMSAKSFDHGIRLKAMRWGGRLLGEGDSSIKGDALIF
jgi:hypothetical protein